MTAAMEVDYLKMNFDAAKKKLSQAALNCRRKGCSTGLHASIHGYFAIIHWLGEDARELAIEQGREDLGHHRFGEPRFARLRHSI